MVNAPKWEGSLGYTNRLVETYSILHETCTAGSNPAIAIVLFNNNAKKKIWMLIIAVK